GRAAYENPVILGGVDALVFGQPAAATTRADVIAAMVPYLEDHLSSGGRVAAVTRHLLNLFRGQPGGRAWRRVISEGAHLHGAGPELLKDALNAVPPDVAHAPLWLPREHVPAPAAVAADRSGDLAADVVADRAADVAADLAA
ncbi:MAG TPA: tRNA-dihydrouridine synthase, partial [Trueperaceae bacterium]|nr:tRNA-dihydrouridine synthase [Trueperaceae bacterium]